MDTPNSEKLAAFDGPPALDKKAEARLRRRIDLHLIPILCFVYISAFIDRINIGNARLAGLETDLGLVGYDYNVCLSAFFVSYILFEIPMLLLCKYVGPGKFLPLCTFAFGLFSMCTAFVKNYSQLVGLRFLLGIAEAPMLPGIAYYLSRWYKKDELVFRLGLYVVCAPLGGAFGGLLATGLQRLDGIGSVHTWQQIFLVEGIITMGIGFFAYLFMPDQPSTARWLSEDEKTFVIERIMEERVAETTLLDTIKRRRVIDNIFETQTLVLAFTFLLNNITVQGAAIFTPTIVATLFPKASPVQKQLRTVPPYVVGGFFTAALPYLAWKTKKRGVYLVFGGVLTMIGYALYVGSSDKHTRYAGSFLVMAGAFPVASLINAWLSANAVSDAGRASSIACVAMFGNLGGLISTWTYLARDAPNYRNGNTLNLSTSSTIIVTVLALLVWMRWQNRKRDARPLTAQGGSGRSVPEYRYGY